MSDDSTCWFVSGETPEEAKKRNRWGVLPTTATCWCKDVCLLKSLKLCSWWFEKQLEKVRKLKGKAFDEGMADIYAMKANTYDGDNEDLIELLEKNAKNHRRRSI